MGTLKDDLIAARALIDAPEKWCKGIKSGCNCAMYAIAAISLTRWPDNSAALRRAVPRSFKRDGLGDLVVAFNDAPDTSHADVMALFDRAIAAAAS
jgi:hypothetical protein